MPQVSGRCVDASGTPVPGIYVYAMPTAGGRFGKAPGTHSRRDGQWSLELTDGQWTVRETGGEAHAVTVGGASVSLDPLVVAAAPAPTRDDIERLLRRRRSTREDA